MGHLEPNSNAVFCVSPFGHVSQTSYPVTEQLGDAQGLGRKTSTTEGPDSDPPHLSERRGVSTQSRGPGVSQPWDGPLDQLPAAGPWTNSCCSSGRQGMKTQLRKAANYIQKGLVSLPFNTSELLRKWEVHSRRVPEVLATNHDIAA